MAYGHKDRITDIEKGEDNASEGAGNKDGGGEGEAINPEALG